MARGRKFVDEVPGEALASIEIGAGSLVRGIEAVIRLAGVGDKVLAVARVIDRMRPGIVHVGGQAVRAKAQGRLERIVVGDRGRLKLIDVNEIGVRQGTAPNALIQVAESEQLAAGRTDVCGLERDTASQLLLNIQIVVLNVWSADMLVHREDVGCSEVAEDRRRA